MLTVNISKMDIDLSTTDEVRGVAWSRVKPKEAGRSPTFSA
jgi:hypothetical protein